MRIFGLVFLAGFLVAGCQAGAPSAPSAAPESARYEVVPIAAEDEPGAPRQVRCQLGASPEQDCTLTPLFGDDSFQLDGEGVTLRMVVTGNEGGLFEVFGPEHRVAVGGVFTRASATDPCWTDSQGVFERSPICIR